MSIGEKIWTFKCRVDEIEVKSNNTWKYDDLSCNFCFEDDMKDTQQHILICSQVLKQSEIYTHIPNYYDLYSAILQNQTYSLNNQN